MSAGRAAGLSPASDSEPAAGCSGAACCRKRPAVVGWPWTSAHCGAVPRPPCTSISWVLAPASSRTCMHPNILIRLGWPHPRACSRSRARRPFLRRRFGVAQREDEQRRTLQLR
eukprot:scaffold62063_cov65-Phaeocystis_antarctica.AAC.10